MNSEIPDLSNRLTIDADDELRVFIASESDAFDEDTMDEAEVNDVAKPENVVADDLEEFDEGELEDDEYGDADDDELNDGELVDEEAAGPIESLEAPPTVAEILARQDNVIEQLDELNLRIESLINEFAAANKKEAEDSAADTEQPTERTDEPAEIKRAA